MATVVPFKAIRPTRDKVHLVASRSVDGYNLGELKEKLAGNPYTFLHVINPDFDDGNRTKPGSRERLVKIKRRFKNFISQKVFQQEEQPCYYLYRQIKENHTYTGIIACTSIDDYTNGIIKIHEQTLTQREEKLKEYLEVCEFNAEPVLFAYPDNSNINELVNDVLSYVPEYDFTTTDKIRHSVWVIKKQKSIKLLIEAFAAMPHIYIADGHHRSASSALLGKIKRHDNKHASGNEAYNFYLGVFFPESQLTIYDYNRVVKDLNGLTATEFLEKLNHKFDVELLNAELFKPLKKHQFSMYFKNKWYALKIKKQYINDAHPVEGLDAEILTQQILSPIFNITNLKTDKRIAFVPGIKGAAELKKIVDSGKAEVAFGLFPVTMKELKLIADTNNIMPPKSTWIEPKMRSGLLIYSLKDEK
ncbi:MAG: DUF1015 domain-containing protein [Bacteroidetes bacterium]|nr:DUF1015 domain-containing protein [Bacteroidota bacterium]